VALNVEKSDVNLFLDTYNANEIQIGMNEMRINDTEISKR